MTSRESNRRGNQHKRGRGRPRRRDGSDDKPRWRPDGGTRMDPRQAETRMNGRRRAGGRTGSAAAPADGRWSDDGSTTGGSEVAVTAAGGWGDESCCCY